MYDDQTSRAKEIANPPPPQRPIAAPRSVDPPASPDNLEEASMPSKLRRTTLTLQAKTYRSAATLVGLLVLLEALGAPRKL
jgi:hypothetical protein